jgi:hypothetical protein
VFLCSSCVDKYDVSSQLTKQTNLPWLSVHNQLLSNMTIVEENTWTRRGAFAARTDVDRGLEGGPRRRGDSSNEAGVGYPGGVTTPVSSGGPGTGHKCLRKRFSSAYKMALDLEGSDQLGSNVWRETSATNPELGTLALP